MLFLHCFLDGLIFIVNENAVWFSQPQFFNLTWKLPLQVLRYWYSLLLQSARKITQGWAARTENALIKCEYYVDETFLQQELAFI